MALSLSWRAEHSALTPLHHPPFHAAFLNSGMGRLNPSRETNFSGTYGNREISIFPAQLTTSRIGNLTRLIHTLLYVMTIHTGKQYRPTTSFTYLGGTVTETPNLSDEIDRRIRAGWMSFKRYKRELYDRLKASLLPLKVRMVRSEVVEALLNACATWTPLKGHYTKLRTTHDRMLLRILGAWCRSPNKRILSYKDALQQTECESIETSMRTRRLLWSGALLRMGDHRLPKMVMSGELENAGKCGLGGEGERMNGLRGRGSSALWHHGGLEHCRT